MECSNCIIKIVFYAIKIYVICLSFCTHTQHTLLITRQQTEQISKGYRPPTCLNGMKHKRAVHERMKSFFHSSIEITVCLCMLQHLKVTVTTRVAFSSCFVTVCLSFFKQLYLFLRLRHYFLEMCANTCLNVCKMINLSLKAHTQ